MAPGDNALLTTAALASLFLLADPAAQPSAEAPAAAAAPPATPAALAAPPSPAPQAAPAPQTAPVPQVAPAPAPAPQAAPAPAPQVAPAPVPQAAPVTPVVAPAAVAPAAPAAGPTARPPERAKPFWLTASLGVERSFAGGMVSSAMPMNDLTSPMLGMRLDVGVRFRKHWVVALVMDGGRFGAPGATMRAECGVAGTECGVGTMRQSLEGRYAFSPTRKRTWWVGAGLGTESTRVMVADTGGTMSMLPTYRGAIFPRVSVGRDWRMSRWWGWGLFASWSRGAFDQKMMGSATDPGTVGGDSRGHSWLDLGIRIIAAP
jgi:hypothetical protein